MMMVIGLMVMVIVMMVMMVTWMLRLVMVVMMVLTCDSSLFFELNLLQDSGSDPEASMFSTPA